jgi:hypothetical protein
MGTSCSEPGVPAPRAARLAPGAPLSSSRRTSGTRREAAVQVEPNLDDVVWRDVDGEIVMMHVLEGTYLSLNRSASALWTALTEGASREQLIDGLVSRFDVDHDAAADDVDEFLQTLRSRGLIR